MPSLTLILDRRRRQTKKGGLEITEAAFFCIGESESAYRHQCSVDCLMRAESAVTATAAAALAAFLAGFRSFLPVIREIAARAFAT